MGNIIEINKCYKVTTERTKSIFKVLDFTKHKDGYLGIEYFEIKASKGFQIDLRGLHEKENFSFNVNKNFIEIEEKELDKLDHAYKCVMAIFNAIIDKPEN